MPEVQSQFIPAGRTARFKQGEREIQVQTEYAPRPAPRITTTILCSGELLKKQETPLQGVISSQQELERVERALLRQHNDALKAFSGSADFGQQRSPFDTLRARLHLGQTDHARGRARSTAKAADNPSAKSDSAAPVRNVAPADAEMSDSERVSVAKRTTLERLYAVEGVDRIYTCDWRGSFVSEKSEREFKRVHGKIYKHLTELIEVFAPLPNDRGREEGVYEVAARRLYLVSHCGFLYFLELVRLPSGGRIEDVVRQALAG